MGDWTPYHTHHLAYGALDDSAVAYLVFDPIDPASGLQRRAMPLGPSRTIVHAEHLATDFSGGRTWAFQVNPGQTLVGDQIPRLHRGSAV